MYEKCLSCYKGHLGRDVPTCGNETDKLAQLHSN